MTWNDFSKSVMCPSISRLCMDNPDKPGLIMNYSG